MHAIKHYNANKAGETERIEKSNLTTFSYNMISGLECQEWHKMLKVKL